MSGQQCVVSSLQGPGRNDVLLREVSSSSFLGKLCWHLASSPKSLVVSVLSEMHYTSLFVGLQLHVVPGFSTCMIQFEYLFDVFDSCFVSFLLSLRLVLSSSEARIVTSNWALLQVLSFGCNSNASASTTSLSFLLLQHYFSVWENSFCSR